MAKKSVSTETAPKFFTTRKNLVHRITKKFVPAGGQIDLGHCTPEAIAWAIEVGQVYDPAESLPGDLIPEDEPDDESDEAGN